MFKTIRISALITTSICFWVFTASPISAATLRWGQSTGDPDGYKVYYGTNSSSPSKVIDVGNKRSYNLDALPLSESIQYYFCVSAYNTAGESDRCDPVPYMPGDTTPPLPPIGLVAYIDYDDPPASTPPSSGTAVVSGLSVSTGKSYQIKSGLSNGDTSYIDRSYTYTNVPTILQNATYVMTANGDKMLSSAQFINFTLSDSATVYIAHDDRISSKPDWLKGFVDTGKDILADVKMSIYAKSFPAGKVSLGANAGVGKCSMYTIAVK